MMKRKAFYFVLVCIISMSTVTWAEDTDGNVLPSDAVGITIGTSTQGNLSANDDVDWFKFTTAANTLYRVTLHGQLDTSYKYMDIYQMDEFGDLHRTIYFNVYSSATSVITVFLETDDPVYVKIYDRAGNYSFNFESLGQFGPDSYPDDCADATGIAINADPIVGTLMHNPDGSFDTDWLVFDTEPLHMYEIKLTKSDNTDLNFRIYSEECQYLLDWSKNHTVTSWFGEKYKIQVAGNPAYMGTYYTLQVIDLGLQADDNYNIFEAATPIVADGSPIEGEIQFLSSYHSDEDWFTFEPTANTLYQFTLTGELNKSYKYMDIYQMDELGALNRTTYFNVHSSAISVISVFLETDSTVYIKMYDRLGGYKFNIEPIGQFLPDGYSDDCAAPKPISVGPGPTKGTLTHNPDGSLEEDWFVFDTEPLHMYEIKLTKSFNTDLNFRVYSEDCQFLLDWSKNRTVTSWFGEKYKIRIAGNPIYLGTYYTLEVIDLGIQTDDYPNIAANAGTIAKDGTPVEGEIQYLSSYHSDEDWFKFIAGQDGDYQFMLTGEVDKSYKYLDIYRQDELGSLHRVTYTNVYGGAVRDISVTLSAGPIFVKIYDRLGKYGFSVISPEPRCGDLDHPYPPGDANQDCYVNIADLALMAANWLKCTAPDGNCL